VRPSKRASSKSNGSLDSNEGGDRIANAEQDTPKQYQIRTQPPDGDGHQPRSDPESDGGGHEEETETHHGNNPSLPECKQARGVLNKDSFESDCRDDTAPNPEWVNEHVETTDCCNRGNESDEASKRQQSVTMLWLHVAGVRATE
jgi:hypothetical protein